MPKPVSVFLSHSSKDVATVEWIMNHARALGIEVYLAERDHQPGQILATKILGRINASDAIIALITRDEGPQPTCNKRSEQRSPTVSRLCRWSRKMLLETP